MSTAVILAGGLSTRMGFDKQLLRVDENWLMKKHVEQLSTVFDHVMIISNSSVISQLDLSEKIMIHQDIIENSGPLGGIYTALKYSQDPYIYVMACDMPTLNIDFINYLYEQLSVCPNAVVAKFGDWIEPFHALYNKEMLEDIKKYLEEGNRCIFGLLEKQNVVYIEETVVRSYSSDWSLFDNINTKEDLKKKTIV